MNWLCRVGAYTLAFGLGVFATILYLQEDTPNRARDLFDSQPDTYPLINPLLSCGDYNEQPPAVIRDLKNDIQSYLSRQTTEGNVVHASLYYRDFNDGPWVGINLETPFSPGSLLKIPLLISLYRQMESDSSFFSKKLTLTRDIAAPQLVPPDHPLVVGQSYTVSELIHSMIAESDNNAAQLLFENVDRASFNRTFTDLGISSPQVDEDYVITVRTYASFFRILYNSTLLSRQSSEQALELLTETAFTKGLAAGVPSSVKVAHKFGEREISSISNLVQLHDCGIVYKPNDPYLLCIMTQGHDIKILEQVIAHISKMVYGVPAP